MKKVILLLAFMLFLPSVYACDYSIKSKQRMLASNVNFNLSYRIVNDNAIFNLIITGLDDSLYVSDGSSRYSGKNIVIDNLKTGTKYKFDIYSDVYSFCSFGSLASKSISVPFYNKYYKDELCLNHQDKDICYRWNNVDMSYDEFKKIVNSFDEKDVIVDDDVSKKNFTGYLGFIVFGIIILSGGIVIFRKRNVGF